ncbi:MAG TPA: hypothetical protein VI685_14750, partial [Candidatus Angelobacter sp.]
EEPRKRMDLRESNTKINPKEPEKKNLRAQRILAVNATGCSGQLSPAALDSKSAPSNTVP